MDLEIGRLIGVRVRLREVSAKGRFKIKSFSREIAGTAGWCPLVRGLGLWEVSVSVGSTVFV